MDEGGFGDLFRRPDGRYEVTILGFMALARPRARHRGGHHDGRRTTAAVVASLAVLLLFGSLGAGVRVVHSQQIAWHAYVTNFDGDGISIVDLQRQAAVATVKTGKKPHGVAVTPDGTTIVVSNEGDGTLTVIDSASHQVRLTLPLGGIPHQLETTADGRHVLVPLNDKGTVAVVDIAAGRVTRTIPIGRGLHIIRRYPDESRYLITSEGDAKVAVLDGSTWRVHRDIPLFAQPRVPGIAPRGDRIYQTIRWLNGALVIDPLKGVVVERVALGEPQFASEGKDAHGVAVTPDGAELWVTTQTTDSVTVVATTDHEVRGRLAVGRDPNWIEITPDGATAVVSNTGGNSVSLIDVRERRVVGTVPVGPGPKRLTLAALARSSH